MTGYQEILTDPSYAGQIVVMTYPHIGNYGVNAEDVESRRPFAAGLIVKEMSPVVSNWRATESLDAYLERNDITALEGLDTRALVIALRDQGAVPGLIVPAEGADPETLRAQAAALPGMAGRNLAREVSVERAYAWDKPQGASRRRFRVVAYDFGIKHNILRSLAQRGVDVQVMPYDCSAADALAERPQGVFLSNGPGDPEPVTEAIAAVRGLLGKVPIFGICLGHQILALALGASTYKLKFGHHGANHPVLNVDTGRVEVTSQNHGFAVQEDSLPETVRMTHSSLNDRTVEGIESLIYPAYSVQYHPEASPGPHDATYLFDRFIAMMERHRKSTA
ncbi:MAG: glutamine-hydrolyzing carbamoyl-phosphate synthase small subunit, partial [Candidatus Lambdaproteobacteria bacterium]|nr:glutamine-hydrolyzing carbamoyl-phosphate synthase small subunit [Candidatus Lambdaproteobacteria bacterium]